MNSEQGVKLISKKLNNIVIELVQGDISDVKADALVNAANNELWMGAGIAGALKRKGGLEIEREAMDKGPVEVGEAVFTSAGKLDARYVIHATVMGADLKTNAGYIKLATYNALVVAEALKAGSVAFPALGTGIGAFPIRECARIMLGVIADYDKEVKTGIRRVIMVLFTPVAFKEFEEEYRKL
jgi:O-acetyl-ADP-ribose deacetylase